MTTRLDGVSVVVTRERPGELADLLEKRGATVVHVPLIRVEDPGDGGVQLARRLGDLARDDWLIVTSAAGAERVAHAAASSPDVRTAAVGATTASVLAGGAGRAVDLVPGRQSVAGLLEAFAAAVDSPQKICLALGDRAGTDLAEGLRRLGHEVDIVTAYRTVAVAIDAVDRARAARADAIVFASGSAVEAWMAAAGERWTEVTPSITVGIGPTTERQALRFGLKLTGVAADHSLTGLVDELVSCVSERSR